MYLCIPWTRGIGDSGVIVSLDIVQYRAMEMLERLLAAGLAAEKILKNGMGMGMGMGMGKDRCQRIDRTEEENSK